jgi:negative regulator of flagellin synthesis FlgM
VELVSAAPDVREDRVAELKAKIDDPAYINETLLNGTVDKIIDVLWPDGGDTLKL